MYADTAVWKTSVQCLIIQQIWLKTVSLNYRMAWGKKDPEEHLAPTP